MALNLILNNKNLVPNIASQNVFQYNFPAGSLTVPEGATMTINQITIPYSWRNISASLGNNTFTYYIPNSSNVQTAYNVVLPDGFYLVSDINTYLQSVLKSNGHYWYNLTNTGTANPTIIYPISISTNVSLYTSTIVSTTIPTSATVVSTFGTGYVKADGAGGSTTWAGGYPTSGNQYASLTFPTTSSTTQTIANLLGFSSVALGTTFYPPQATTTASSTTANGNSLSAQPQFAPKGSLVNGVVVRCNLVSNPTSIYNDVLDSFPIFATYGSNINYLPISINDMRLKAGKYSSLQITFNDDNFNTLNILDPTVLISLIITFP
jgi:hypothetical protein